MYNYRYRPSAPPPPQSYTCYNGQCSQIGPGAGALPVGATTYPSQAICEANCSGTGAWTCSRPMAPCGPDGPCPKSECVQSTAQAGEFTYPTKEACMAGCDGQSQERKQITKCAMRDNLYWCHKLYRNPGKGDEEMTPFPTYEACMGNCPDDISESQSPYRPWIDCVVATISGTQNNQADISGCDKLCPCGYGKKCVLDGRGDIRYCANNDMPCPSNYVCSGHKQSSNNFGIGQPGDPCSGINIYGYCASYPMLGVGAVVAVIAAAWLLHSPAPPQSYF